MKANEKSDSAAVELVDKAADKIVHAIAKLIAKASPDVIYVPESPAKPKLYDTRR